MTTSTLKVIVIYVLVSISFLSAPLSLSFLQRVFHPRTASSLCSSKYSLFRTRLLLSSKDDTTTSIEYQLENSINIQDFISKSGALKLQGVFVLEDSGDATLIVESSNDVRTEVESIISTYTEEKFSKIRLQTFSSSNDAAIFAAYKAELTTQTNPKITNYRAKAIQSPFQSPPPQPPQTAAASPSSSSKLPPGELELTMENVNRVLDEVRPYLVADGGNVAVVSVDSETRDIALALQGACGSCASSTTTMKMGIERVLKENFPRLGSITSVNQPDPEKETPVLTVDMVTDSLQNILSAVKAMNGTVSIRDVDGAAGTVYLRFAGPPRLKKGLELVLKDNALVKAVVFEDLA